LDRFCERGAPPRDHEVGKEELEEVGEVHTQGRADRKWEPGGHKPVKFLRHPWALAHEVQGNLSALATNGRPKKYRVAKKQKPQTNREAAPGILSLSQGQRPGVRLHWTACLCAHNHHNFGVLSSARPSDTQWLSRNRKPTIKRENKKEEKGKEKGQLRGLRLQRAIPPRRVARRACHLAQGKSSVLHGLGRHEDADNESHSHQRSSLAPLPWISRNRKPTNKRENEKEEKGKEKGQLRGLRLQRTIPPRRGHFLLALLGGHPGFEVAQIC